MLGPRLEGERGVALVTPTLDHAKPALVIRDLVAEASPTRRPDPVRHSTPTAGTARRRMMCRVTAACALLLTGAFGVGKTALAEEIADLLEVEGRRFAAIDLDWLAWANAPGAGHDEHLLLATNLGAVVENDRRAGVRTFVLAGSVADRPRLEAIRGAVAMPLLVLEVTAPLRVIEVRLGASPTTGRRDDLRRARDWVAAGTGAGLEDGEVENVGPLRETAQRVVELFDRWAERLAPG